MSVGGKETERVLSSAYKIYLKKVEELGRLFMYIKNNNGLNIDYWGNPCVTSRTPDDSWPITVN